MTESATACDTLSAGETNSRVSIIIPYFKQEAFLNEALQSVRQQSYPNLEIIVVDDGSPVPAKDVLAACPSPELEHLAIYRTENGGCPTARNFGFKQSSGEYLLFLDSDDKLIPGAIEAHLRAFSKQPAAGLSFGSARIIDEGSRVVCHPPLCRPRKNYFFDVSGS